MYFLLPELHCKTPKNREKYQKKRKKTKKSRDLFAEKRFFFSQIKISSEFNRWNEFSFFQNAHFFGTKVDDLRSADDLFVPQSGVSFWLYPKTALSTQFSILSFSIHNYMCQSYNNRNPLSGWFRDLRPVRGFRYTFIEI